MTNTIKPTEYSFKDSVNVELVKASASDNDVIWAARVSTQGERSLDTVFADNSQMTDEELAAEITKARGLIQFLLRERHMSPFEHSIYTFYIDAPLFVMRELMRHRTSSFNEASARYSKMPAAFYVPSCERALQQVGKPGAYEFVAGTDEQYNTVVAETKQANIAAYESYEKMLAAGVAREVARGVLPVNLFSQTYMTVNMRNLMHFLSLRTKHEAAKIKSYPQIEIAMVADQMEAHFAANNPLVYEAFNKFGRDV
jgi:thymidylate synthase (FAD)